MATIKISDLSVGDWVMVNEKPRKISVLANVWNGSNEVLVGYVVHVYPNGYNVVFYKPIEKVKPIPITAEILLKNGWENLRSGYKCSCGVYDIHIWIKEASVIVTIYEQERILKATRMQVYSPDMSIHQLQHILRLAGVDKEINL